MTVHRPKESYFVFMTKERMENLEDKRLPFIQNNVLSLIVKDRNNDIIAKTPERKSMKIIESHMVFPTITLTYACFGESQLILFSWNTTYIYLV